MLTETLLEKAPEGDADTLPNRREKNSPSGFMLLRIIYKYTAYSAYTYMYIPVRAAT
jgi:hypothetical protein